MAAFVAARQICAVVGDVWRLKKRVSGFWPKIWLAAQGTELAYGVRKRWPAMRNLSKLGFAFALTFLNVQPVFSQATEDALYRDSVEYDGGKISVYFDQIPVGVALNAIQIKTGLEITVPPATESKLLNLRLSRLPLEPAVRSLIASIGYRSFALVYDEEGHPKRAVVLEVRPEVSAISAADARTESGAEPVAEALSEKERAQLQKELEGWGELKQEERSRIEERLKTLPPSDDREQLVKEYGRQLLGIKN